jgi:phenylacetate-CoA ligase
MPPAQPAGFVKALDLFQSAARRVPAYRDFLRCQGIKPENIKTPADFAGIPPVTKQNYLRQYPLRDLLWDGDFANAHLISMSSGSSGTPFFWLRGRQSILDSVHLHDRIFTNSFGTREKSTLCIIAFAMGTWIAGTYTTFAVTELANRGHRIVAITPGINIQENVYILRNLAPAFEQVILAGYPPLVKDILDEAAYQGISLADLNLNLLFAGENFSEAWRDYNLKTIGFPNDVYRSATIYGTADAGCLGFETPLSIYLRRASTTCSALRQALFGDTPILPTFVQYDPDIRYFETEGEALVFTTETSIPLVRYMILDHGRLTPTKTIRRLASQLPEGTHNPLLRFNTLPYISLYSRADVAATFYAVNIYPENIKYGLESPQLSRLVTGKFILETRFTETSQEPLLHLQIELKQDVVIKTAMAEEIRDHVVLSLRKYNSEYAKLHQEIGQRAVPLVQLVPYGTPAFQIRVKHRWTPAPQKA